MYLHLLTTLLPSIPFPPPEVMVGVIASVILGSLATFAWKSFIGGAREQIFGRIEAKVDAGLAFQDKMSTDMQSVRDNGNFLRHTVIQLQSDLSTAVDRLNKHLDSGHLTDIV